MTWRFGRTFFQLKKVGFPGAGLVKSEDLSARVNLVAPLQRLGNDVSCRQPGVGVGEKHLCDDEGIQLQIMWGYQLVREGARGGRLASSNSPPTRREAISKRACRGSVGGI